MGRELQKKKNRSSIPKIKLKPKSKKHANPLGNPIIAANWQVPLPALPPLNYTATKLTNKSGTPPKPSPKTIAA